MSRGRWWALVTLSCAACGHAATVESPTTVEIPAAIEERNASNAKPASPEEECNRVTELVNAAVTEIERISQERAGSEMEAAQGMRKISAVWSKLGDDLDSLQISAVGLKDTMRQYRLMCKRGVTAALELATTMENKDYPGQTRTRRAYDEVAAEEDGIVDRINLFCQ